MSAIPSTGWQAGFLNVLPAVRTHARIQFRHLRAERREDAVQEAIASACVSYQLLSAKGKLDVAHPATLATFAVKHVRSGRHVGGKRDAARDVLSPLAQARHRFATADLDAHDPHDRENETWRGAVLADRKYPIPDTAAFRIDFAEWLKTLTSRHRHIVYALAAGDGTGTLARRFGITAGRVSQLRRQYERQWQTFQGEAA